MKKVLLISRRTVDEEHKLDTKIHKLPLKKKRIVELNFPEESLLQNSCSTKFNFFSFDDIDELLTEGMSFGLDMRTELSTLQKVLIFLFCLK
jgi:hypothetical protein